MHVNSVRAQLRSVPIAIKDHEFDLDVYIWADLDANTLRQKVRNAGRYKLTELQRAVSWFSAAQLHWGAGDLVRVGVEIFAEELCNFYHL
ncbi:MAG: hypothetical protein QOJ16_1685 [Acidobacteriota bacterium]|jgi:hypothetical protein|nr:hypothetical protein [Acidobacteriota bacterium]